MKLRSNLHIIGGYGTREVEVVARLPDGTVTGKGKIKAPAKVTERYSTHNAITQQGQLYFLQTIQQGLTGFCSMPTGYSNSRPPNPGTMLLTTSSGAVLSLIPSAYPQVISPFRAVIYYIATLTVNSPTTITSAKLYVYLTLSGNQTFSTPQFELAEASVNITLQPNVTYSLIWEVEIVNNYTDARQYNTMVWLAYMFYNSTGYMATSSCVNGYQITLITTYGQEVSPCNVKYYVSSYNIGTFITYINNQNQVVSEYLFVLTNPGQENIIQGIIGWSGNGVIYNGSSYLGCQLIVLQGIDYVVQYDPSQNPYVMLVIQVTVEGT